MQVMLTDFADLPMPELTAELERMLRDKKDDQAARAERYARQRSTPAASQEITAPPPCTECGAAGTTFEVIA